jgi:hypothetical protein
VSTFIDYRTRRERRVGPSGERYRRPPRKEPYHRNRRYPQSHLQFFKELAPLLAQCLILRCRLLQNLVVGFLQLADLALLLQFSKDPLLVFQGSLEVVELPPEPVVLIVAALLLQVFVLRGNSHRRQNRLGRHRQ